MKINNFRGDLSDMSAKTATMERLCAAGAYLHRASAVADTRRSKGRGRGACPKI